MKEPSTWSAGLWVIEQGLSVSSETHPVGVSVAQMSYTFGTKNVLHFWGGREYAK